MTADRTPTTEAHDHRFDLQLGPDGRGQLYGDYEGYVRRCRCGIYAPDYIAWRNQRERRALPDPEIIAAEQYALHQRCTADTCLAPVAHILVRLAIEDEARQQDFGALRDAIGTALELHAENRCSDMDELLSAALAVHPAPEEKPR